MKDIHKANLALLIVMVLMTAGGFVLKSVPNVVSWTLPQYIFIFIPSIIFLIINKKNIKSTLRLNKLGLKNFFLVVLITLAMRPFLSFVSYLASKFFDNQVVSVISEGTKGFPLLLLLFAVAVTPAICEETILRGVVLDGYKHMSFKKAILANGLLFGMFHMNFYQFTYTFFMGIVLAASVIITNSIYASMTMHFINNSIDVFILYLLQKRYDFKDLVQAANVNKGANDGILLIVPAIISLIILISLFKRLIIVNNKSKNIFNTNYNKKEKIINWSFLLIVFVSFGISFLILLKSKI